MVILPHVCGCVGMWVCGYVSAWVCEVLSATPIHPHTHKQLSLLFIKLLTLPNRFDDVKIGGNAISNSHYGLFPPKPICITMCVVARASPKPSALGASASVKPGLLARGCNIVPELWPRQTWQNGHNENCRNAIFRKRPVSGGPWPSQTTPTP